MADLVDQARPREKTPFLLQAHVASQDLDGALAGGARRHDQREEEQEDGVCRRHLANAIEKNMERENTVLLLLYVQLILRFF